MNPMAAARRYCLRATRSVTASRRLSTGSRRVALAILAGDRRVKPRVAERRPLTSSRPKASFGRKRTAQLLFVRVSGLSSCLQSRLCSGQWVCQCSRVTGSRSGPLPRWSCGIARSEREVGARELIRRADTALYRGKKTNPGGVTAYSSEFEVENQHRQYAINEVKAAIRHDRLFAAYQPIVDLETGDYVGFEALLRLHSRNNQRLSATEVLPALLDPAISRQLSRKMTEFVSSEISTLFEHFPDIGFVSLNATESDLLDPTFVERFLTALRNTDVDLARIVLEVTETMLLVNDPSTVKKVLWELSAAGIKIALDDFGTGFSSLSHLRDFPIDKVKIDRSFIQGMVLEQESRLLVQAIIGMAKSLGKKVIAEGVESEEQRRLLLQMGCPVAQGFLYSPALDVCQITLRSQDNRSKKYGNVRAA